MKTSILLSLSCALALTACTGDQSYVPIGEEQQDELCTQSNLDIIERESVALEFDDSGSGSFDGSLDVTLFSRTEMRVETTEIIVSVPADKIAAIDVEEGTWELFTNMVFTVDVRSPGDGVWQSLTVTTNLYDIFWFTNVELNGGTSKVAVSTLRLCSTLEASQDAIDFSAFDITGDYEVRIRAFPFEGAGDLVGTYDYTVNVSLF